MSNETTPLYMVRMRARADRLMALGRRRRLPLRETDLGYLVHSQLGGLFGDRAPAPFAVTDDRGRWLTVLAYGDRSDAELEDHARAFSDPAIYATLEWESFSSKPMPERWARGRRLAFELRACPIVRLASAGPSHTTSKRPELDAFLARCTREPDRRHDRQEVYREWLEAQLDRQGGARPVSISIEGYKRERLLRPTHRQKSRFHRVERPDVTFSGELEVIDEAGFGALVRRGVGRHRAFGFGMLLLQPARGG